MEEVTPLDNINSIINLNENKGGFATGINYVGGPKQEKEITLPPIKKQTPPSFVEEEKVEEKKEETIQIRSPTFFEVELPEYDPNNLSLPIPVDIIKIKKNAFNSINSSGKIKFAEFLKTPALRELIDALISDSFWFVVCFFQSKNIKNNKQDEDSQISKSKISKNEKYNIISEILCRMSCNYFKFFIRVCDLGQTRKNDSALNSFKNFMSYSVYYSIYLAFPKSRHLFNDDFRNRIVYFFTYLFNGLVSENYFVELQWSLDLGKGNIIENYVKSKDVVPMKLPEMIELQGLIEYILNKGKFKGKISKSKNKKKIKEINTDILNTPLYRIYAETNKFETLNLVKPIKMSNRKIIDIYQINKIHAGYVKFAKETLKNAAERKAQYFKKLREKEEEFQKQINEIKCNEERIKKELENIKIQRVQEYANYCIFLSK